MDNAAQPGWTLPLAFFFIYIFATFCVVFGYHMQHVLGPEERDHEREERDAAAEKEKGHTA